MEGKRVDAPLARALGWSTREGGKGRYWVDANGRFRGYEANGAPCLSTTWQGMGQVVEAMRAKGWSFCLKVFPDGVCWAEFWRGLELDGYRKDDAPPMSVALAACMALGVSLE